MAVQMEDEKVDLLALSTAGLWDLRWELLKVWMLVECWDG